MKTPSGKGGKMKETRYSFSPPDMAEISVI